MNEKVAVVSPEGLPLAAQRQTSPPLASLDGAVIGEVYNNHFKGELMFRTYRRLLKERFPNITIIPYNEFPTVYVGGDPASQKKIAGEVAALAKEKGCNAIISGNGG
jgi:hypothetical protein